MTTVASTGHKHGLRQRPRGCGSPEARLPPAQAAPGCPPPPSVPPTPPPRPQPQLLVLFLLNTHPAASLPASLSSPPHTGSPRTLWPGVTCPPGAPQHPRRPSAWCHGPASEPLPAPLWPHVPRFPPHCWGHAELLAVEQTSHASSWPWAFARAILSTQSMLPRPPTLGSVGACCPGPSPPGTSPMTATQTAGTLHRGSETPQPSCQSRFQAAVPFISCSTSSERPPHSRVPGSACCQPLLRNPSSDRWSQFGVQSCGPRRHAGRWVAPGRDEGGEPGGEGETAPPAGRASPAGGGARRRGAGLREAGSLRPAATLSSCPPSAAVNSPRPDRGC